MKKCKVNDCIRPVKTKGYCATHYARMLRYGTATEENPIRKFYTGCSVNGCTNPHIARGLCEMHYRRFHNHGSTDKPNRLRSSLICVVPNCGKETVLGNYCKEHKKERKRISYNTWYSTHKKIKVARNMTYVKTKSGSEVHRKAYRKWAKKNPDKLKSGTLRFMYGVDLIDKQNMLIAQQNRCKICNTSIDITSACMDHDHHSGFIRALLCHPCNRALGQFKESKIVLKNALQYLEDYDFSFVHCKEQYQKKKTKKGATRIQIT